MTRLTNLGFSRLSGSEQPDLNLDSAVISRSAAFPATSCPSPHHPRASLLAGHHHHCRKLCGDLPHQLTCGTRPYCRGSCHARRHIHLPKSCPRWTDPIRPSASHWVSSTNAATIIVGTTWQPYGVGLRRLVMQYRIRNCIRSGRCKLHRGNVPRLLYKMTNTRAVFMLVFTLGKRQNLAKKLNT